MTGFLASTLLYIVQHNSRLSASQFWEGFHYLGGMIPQGLLLSRPSFPNPFPAYAWEGTGFSIRNGGVGSLIDGEVGK